MKSNIVSVLNLGRFRYLPALAIQNLLVKRIQESMSNASDPANTLILVEHDPVYTTGIRTKGYTLADEEKLKKLGADFVRTNRGGLITFHGPGQLVVYPILNLKTFAPEHNRRKAMLGMKWYVNMLEQLVIDLISKWGVKGTRSPHTGVWVGNSKICAMGVHNSNMVTSHGIALNCNTDLQWFNHIVPCGIEGSGVTSLTAEVGLNITIEEVQDFLVKQFTDTFQCRTKILSKEERDEIISSI